MLHISTMKNIEFGLVTRFICSFIRRYQWRLYDVHIFGANFQRFIKSRFLFIQLETLFALGSKVGLLILNARTSTHAHKVSRNILSVLRGNYTGVLL